MSRYSEPDKTRSSSDLIRPIIVCIRRVRWNSNMCEVAAQQGTNSRGEPFPPQSAMRKSTPSSTFAICTVKTQSRFLAS